MLWCGDCLLEKDPLFIELKDLSEKKHSFNSFIKKLLQMLTALVSIHSLLLFSSDDCLHDHKEMIR